MTWLRRAACPTFIVCELLLVKANTIKRNDAFSITKGLSFYFDDEGAEIYARFSTLTGLEEIHIDGNLAYSKRNFSIDSSIRFTSGKTRYKITLIPIDPFKGPIVCTLSKDGTEYQRQIMVFTSMSQNTGNQNFFTASIFLTFLAVLSGIGFAHWEMTNDPTYAALSAAGLIVYPYSFYRRFAAGARILEDTV